MFEGRRFAHGDGYKEWAIRFADCKTQTGVATTAYSFGMRGSAGIHVKPSRNRLKCLSPLTFSTLSSLDVRPLQPGSQPN